LDDGNPIRMSP